MKLRECKCAVENCGNIEEKYKRRLNIDFRFTPAE
jgi:hypothetical protein